MLRRRRERIFLIYGSLLASMPPYCYFLCDSIVEASRYVLFVVIASARLIGGMGILGTVFAVATYLFRLIPRPARRSRMARILVKLVAVLGFLAVLSIPIVCIMRLIWGASIGSFGTLWAIMDIALFVGTIYILPALKGGSIEEDTLSRIRRTFRRIGIKLKKAYYKYFTRDLIKAYSVEFLYMRARLDEYRVRVAWGALPVVAIMLAPILPAAIIGVLATKRIKEGKARTIDRVSLAVSFGVTTVFLIYAMADYCPPIYLWIIPYVIGATIGLLLLGDALLDIVRE